MGVDVGVFVGVDVGVEEAVIVDVAVGVNVKVGVNVIVAVKVGIVVGKAACVCAIAVWIALSDGVHAIKLHSSAKIRNAFDCVIRKPPKCSIVVIFCYKSTLVFNAWAIFLIAAFCCSSVAPIFRQSKTPTTLPHDEHCTKSNL
jgi:hypothetical protein